MVFLTTEPPFVVEMARRREVSIKTTAAIVVSLLRKVAAPRLPKRVWLEPPKAAPSSAPLLLCINTIKIRNRDTSMWIISKKVVI